MIMDHYKETRSVTRVCFGYTCDFCGVQYSDKNMEEIVDTPITSFSITPSYGSSFDGDKYNFEICDKCLSNLLAHKSIQLIDSWEQQ